jgi:hypothetical protein
MYDTNTDRLYKIRSLLERQSGNFSVRYLPEPRLALDERMFAWRGRL